MDHKVDIHILWTTQLTDNCLKPYSQETEKFANQAIFTVPNGVRDPVART